MSDFTKVGGPIPANLGRCVDLYHDVRALRLAMEKEVKDMMGREAELKLHLINTLSKQDDKGAVGLRYMARRVDKTAFSFAKAQTDEMEQEVEGSGGWQRFTAWVRQTGRFDFLQKRIGEAAVKDMLEQTGQLPPGIEKITVPDLSVVKVG